LEKCFEGIVINNKKGFMEYKYISLEEMDRNIFEKISEIS
jgi:hypothetical protein